MPQPGTPLPIFIFSNMRYESPFEATSLFLDLATYGYFPPVYYYQGRAREGMKTAGYADSYKKYVSIRGSAGEDSLLADIKHRVQ